MKYLKSCICLILLTVIFVAGCKQYQLVGVNDSALTKEQKDRFDFVGMRIQDGGNISGKIILLNKETGQIISELENHGGKTPVAYGFEVLKSAANNVGAGALIGSGLRNMNTDSNSFSSTQNN